MISCITCKLYSGVNILRMVMYRLVARDSVLGVCGELRLRWAAPTKLTGQHPAEPAAWVELVVHARHKLHPWTHTHTQLNTHWAGCTPD